MLKIELEEKNTELHAVVVGLKLENASLVRDAQDAIDEIACLNKRLDRSAAGIDKIKQSIDTVLASKFPKRYYGIFSNDEEREEYESCEVENLLSFLKEQSLEAGYRTKSTPDGTTDRAMHMLRR